MLRAAMIIAVAITASSGAVARDTTQVACDSAWNSLSRWDKSTTTYERYTTTCLRNNGITTTIAATPVTGRCRDGTYTSETNRKSACTEHLGVVEWHRF